MNRPSIQPATSPRSGFTLLETVISLGMTLLLLAVVGVLFNAATATVSTSQSMTATLIDGEHCLSMVASEIRDSSVQAKKLELSSTGLQPGGVTDSVSYSRLEGSDSNDLLALKWAEPRVICWDRDGEETPNNGLDDDGDGLIDEGRVILRRASATAGVIVLAKDVTRFELTLLPGDPQGRARVGVAVTIQRGSTKAVRNTQCVGLLN